MKVFKTTQAVSAEKVKAFLDDKLNPLFEQRRQSSICFNIVTDNEALLITNENYEDPLFRIELKGNEIDVTKSEHYTDDINAIALESSLEELFAKFPEDGNIDYVRGEN